MNTQNLRQLKEAEVLIEEKEKELYKHLSTEQKVALLREKFVKRVHEYANSNSNRGSFLGNIVRLGNHKRAYTEPEAMAYFADQFSGQKLTRGGVKSELERTGVAQNDDADVFTDIALHIEYPGNRKFLKVSYSGSDESRLYQLLTFAAAENFDYYDTPDVVKPQNKNLKYFRPVCTHASEIGMLGKILGMFK